MKKISMKQLLVNAMEEYGNNLILSDRFWFRSQPPVTGNDIDKKQHTAVGGKKQWKQIWNRKRYWISTISTANIWTGFIFNFLTRYRRYHNMSMKKNLIRGMQAIGEMRAVIGE